LPLTAALKSRLNHHFPCECLVNRVRRLRHQFWAHLLPFVLMVLLCCWLTLQAAGAIDRHKPPAGAIVDSVTR